MTIYSVEEINERYNEIKELRKKAAVAYGKMHDSKTQREANDLCEEWTNAMYKFNDELQEIGFCEEIAEAIAYPNDDINYEDNYCSDEWEYDQL